MSMRSAPGNARLLAILLLPSWLSGLIAVVVGFAVIGGPVALTHVGGAAQQSLLGLHRAYHQSSFGSSVQNSAANAKLNDVLLFVLWGAVGLVVYSILQNIVNGFSSADRLASELHYVNAYRRHSMMRGVALRAAVRIGALIAWWLLLRVMVYKLAPYAVASARLSALHLTSVGGWTRSLLAGAVCALGVHGLAVLLRLLVLRPRLFGGGIFS